MYRNANHTYPWGDHLQVIAGFREHKNLLQNVIHKEPIYEKEFCIGEIEECTLSDFEVFKRVVFSPYWIHTILNIFFDDPVVYNMSILLTFVLTGLSGYLLAETFLLRKKDIGFDNINYLPLISSLIVVLAPIRIHHLLVGHRNGWMLWCFIMFMWFIELYFLSDRNKNKRKVLCLEVLLSLTLVYFVFTEHFFVLYSLLYIGFRIVFEEISRQEKIRNIQKLLSIKWLVDMVKKYTWLVIVVFLLFIFNSIDKLQSITSSSVQEGRPIELIKEYSPPFHYLWQNGILEHEHNIYLGFGIFVLLVAIIILITQISHNLKKQKILKDLDLLGFYVLLSIFFILISLGTNTILYELMYEYMPFFKFSRTPARAMFFVFPMLSVLFILIMSNINLQLKNKFTAPIFLIIVIISFHSFQPISLVSMPQAREIQDGQKVLFIPYTEPGHFFGSLYEFYLSDTNSVSLNGYVPFPSIEAVEFTEKYFSRLNTYPETKDESLIEEIQENYFVDNVIILNEYVEDERI